MKTTTTITALLGLLLVAHEAQADEDCKQGQHYYLQVLQKLGPQKYESQVTTTGEHVVVSTRRRIARTGFMCLCAKVAGVYHGQDEQGFPLEMATLKDAGAPSGKCADYAPDL